MTAVGGIGAPTARPAEAAAKPAGTLDQNDFLRLMTTQMLTQDPFNPMDNQQMVAQMAQFSSVAGISEMNKSLQALADWLTGGGPGDLSGWIGRSMLVPTSIAAPRADGSYAGEIALAAPAERLVVSFADQDGTVVHSQQLGARDAGQVAFSWDGRGAEGAPVAGGPLRVSVRAIADGAATSPTVATWTDIAGVGAPGSGAGASLVTGLGPLSPGDALRLS